MDQVLAQVFNERFLVVKLRSQPPPPKKTEKKESSWSVDFQGDLWDDEMPSSAYTSHAVAARPISSARSDAVTSKQQLLLDQTGWNCGMTSMDPRLYTDGLMKSKVYAKMI
ncbi:hypothetical protein EVAR_44944_1 [Eumeta japonica]|uniref:Uncharacterized protein n=1 Tax=Eumeta variegata TaxID=151549 RepID=A0A4C1W2I9_EUMVA|nr:hypothetical protein EVAR_44944_1 [Eumeta japonica]